PGPQSSRSARAASRSCVLLSSRAAVGVTCRTLETPTRECGYAMDHPDIGLLVVDAVAPPVDSDRLKGSRHDVATARREVEARPLLPLADPSAHGVPPRGDAKDPGAQAPVNAEPRIE